MNEAVQIISDLFKSEVANQVEAKVINAANVKILQAQNEIKDKEIEQLKLEIEAIRTEYNTLKAKMEKTEDEPVVVDVIGEE